jgi:uncharacterized membrane protein
MYKEELSDRSRLILVVIALVYGVFSFTLNPLLIQITWENLMEKILSLIPTQPAMEQAPFFQTFWFSATRSISIMAGVTLVVIAYSLWKKEPWAYPLSLLCIALPIILNVVLAVPHLAQGLGMPVNVFIIIFGLICYWTFILLKPGTLIEKVSRFAVFTLLGIIAGQLNILVLHGTKSALTSGLDMTLFDPKISIYTIEAPVNLFAIVMLSLSIYLLASQNQKGYFLALVAGVAVFLVNMAAQLIRMETFDFLAVAVYAVVLIVLLLIPAVKESLFEPASD